MKVDKILDSIENKIFESKTMFPNTLGSGNSKELSKECREFRANLMAASISLQKIQKIIEKVVY